MNRTLAVVLALSLAFTGCLKGGEQLAPSQADPGASPSSDRGSGPDDAAGSSSSKTEASNDSRDANATGPGEASTSEPTGSRTPETESVSANPPDPGVTVAVVDTGANLYHRAFRASEPADRIPENATPVSLTLGTGDWRSGVESDWGELMALESGELYRFPGTVFAGAISFLEPPGCIETPASPCDPSLSWPRILDDPANGTPHGTWTASRVVGPGMGLATDEDVRLVLVQVQLNGTSIAKGFDWVEDQDWIDAVSVSLFARQGLADNDFLDTLHSISQDKPTFVSTGNGLGNVGVAPKPDWAEDGLPDTIAVGGVDNDRVAYWTDQDPYVSADACRTPLARADSTTGTNGDLGGTSFAAPYAAGAGAQIILHARERLGDDRRGPTTNDSLAAPAGAWDSNNPSDAQVVLAEGEPGPIGDGPLADGDLTLRELKDVLYHTAVPTPTVHPHDGERCIQDRIPAETVPQDARFPLIGYGEVTPSSLDKARSVLDGTADVRERPAADDGYDRAHELRSTTTRGQPPDGPGSQP